MKNLILGLGGTGARIVESFVHLCATGLGPSRAAVAFIDQDQSNGNTLRARTALARYASARGALRALTDGHDDLGCDLLATDLCPHPDGKDVDRCHWAPQQSDASLAKLVGYNLMPDEARDLARALFHRRNELDMSLNEGYRGRPHVGSAALLVRIGQDEFWRSLEDVVRNANEEVRVFLCGSVFGGTGAAILPTLARRLRQVAKEKDRPLRTAGALMLPYFTFPPPADRGANVVAGAELLLQSQSALRYYDNEMKVGGAPYSFDDLYVVGWRPAIELDYHAAGAAKQANPPLAPELLGALAAAKFFAEERPPRERGGGDEAAGLHIIARENPHRLTWADLPSVTDRKPTRAAYAAWLRFCALWRFNYAGAFTPDPPPGATEEAWFRLLRDDGEPAARRAAVGGLSDYVSTALRYAATMSAFSRWGGDRSRQFDLWAHRPLAEVDLGDPTATPDLASGSLARDLTGFDELVRGLDGAPDAAAVYWAVSEKRRTKSVDLWPFIARLHECAAAPSST